MINWNWDELYKGKEEKKRNKDGANDIESERVCACVKNHNQLLNIIMAEESERQIKCKHRATENKLSQRQIRKTSMRIMKLIATKKPW